MYSSQPGEEWYVVFTEAKIQHWIYKIVDRDMGHTYAIKDLNDYQWLVVQPRINCTEIKIKLKCQYPHIKMLTGPDAKIIKVTSMNTSPRGTLNFFNCVEQVKALIGIKDMWCLTPKQLYNDLIGDKHGGNSKQDRQRHLKDVAISWWSRAKTTFKRLRPGRSGSQKA